MNKIIKEDLELIYKSDLNWRKLKNSTVLVTGAYGLLASYMVYMLLYLNKLDSSFKIKTLILVRNIEKAEKKFVEYLDDPNLQIIKGDVSEKIEVDCQLDYIIHAASPASSQFYGTNPISVIMPNVFGTKYLLDLAVTNKVKGFLFFSSGEVCGKIEKEFINEEDSGFLNPTDIRSCYGESKRMAENICICYYHQHKIPVYIVRPDHTYGPTMDLENDNRVFSEFVSNIINNKDIVIKSDGLATRTFCYLSDATEGFFRVLLNGKPGKSYNVSNPNGKVTIRELAEILVSSFPEKNLRVTYQQGISNNQYLENKHKLRPSLSTKKIEDIGYNCRVSVKDGFSRTVKSFNEGVK